jgi:hypothetical protein
MTMEKEELLNGLKARFGPSQVGLVDDLRKHLVEGEFVKPRPLEPDMPTIQIIITLTPSHGGYSMQVDGKPADGVQADTVVDACLRAARFYEALQRQHETRTIIQEVIATLQHA